MLVGRSAERRAIQALVAAARVGQSSVLVLTGEAGIGKTVLLEDVAAGSGTTVLRATGTESESEVPFGALLQVLRPAMVHVDRIPAPQSAALAAALALRPGTGGDRFAIGAATLSLLSRFAEDQPLVVLVDDAHLLDVPSAQALTFAARRLTADPIVVLAGVREGQACPFTEAGLPVMHLAGLSLAGTSELLTASGHQLDDQAVARLHAFSGGNPLALVELAEDVESLAPEAAGVPVLVPAVLARAFAHRVDRLSSTGRTAALVAATGGGDLDVVARACRLLGVDVADLGEAEEAGLLRVDADTVVFRHTLVRSAVYSDAPAATRRSVHRALAASLPAEDADRRAWHLGEAALGPDEDLASALDAVAGAARDRSAHAVAARASERAAQLSPGPEDRVRRLVAAGDSAWQAGLGDSAVALLERASQLHPSAAAVGGIAGLRGRIAARTGFVDQARDQLRAAGTSLSAADPDEAVLLLGEAILACFFLADTATVAQLGRLVDSLVERAGTERARVVGALAGGIAGVLTGAGGPEAMRRALEQVDPAGPLTQDPRVAPWLVLGPLFLRESETGRLLVPTVVEGLRRRGAVGELPFLLFHVGRDQATTDRWDLAESTYAEGVQLAREAGLTTDLTACLAGSAWLEARQGREAPCREHAGEALSLSGAHGIALFQCWSLSALGELELGLGRPEAALVHLEQLDELLRTLELVDVDLSPAPEVVDVLVRLGREDEARERAAGYAERAAAKGQPWALARAARAVALLAADDQVDEQFGRALDHHALTPDVFEQARTQLAYGARLRRARRRVDARPVLRAAVTTFDALGAAPWADQAAHELSATGETAQRRGVSPLRGLTPQEVQVARMLAAGRTTREAAAALFLSPKTVEYHLRHVYVKLGIRSRAELAAGLDGWS